MKIENEQAFPIYGITAKWIQDGEHDDKHSSNHKGLRKGRIWNSTFSRKMLKEELSEESQDLFSKEWWKKTKNNSLKDKNPRLKKLKIEFKEYEVWNGTWFSHETFDVGKSDREVLDSFERFVERKTRLNEDNGYYNNEMDIDNKNPYYCLMGAEDTWRWCGSGDDGESESRTDPPCRCKHCKEQGMIRIGH